MLCHKTQRCLCKIINDDDDNNNYNVFSTKALMKKTCKGTFYLKTDKILYKAIDLLVVNTQPFVMMCFIITFNNYLFFKNIIPYLTHKLSISHSLNFLVLSRVSHVLLFSSVL